MSESDTAQAAPRETREWTPPSLAPAAPTSGAPAPDAAPDVESIRRKAYEEAYAEGLAAGRAQGESIVAEMSVLLQGMAAPFRDSEATLLRELVGLVERTVSAVVDREVESGAYDLEAVLDGAMQVLGTVRVPVELRLHPMDAALVRDLGLSAEPPIEIIEDDKLRRGGLNLRAGHRVVDASIEARVDEVLKGLRLHAGMPEASEPAESAKTTPGEGLPDD